MKKIIVILFALALVTACDNEPLDPAFNNPNSGNNGGNNNGGSQSADLTLSQYELDIDLAVNFFGTTLQTITNSDINVSDNKITTSTVTTEVAGAASITENQTYTRNASGQITENKSVSTAGVTTNEYTITYANNRISQITYDYFEGNDDDYVYNFTYNGNDITRTQVGSNISTIFTLDGFNRVIKKESFENGFSIQLETLTYNAVGNINSSIASGEISSNHTYTFDDNTNPLQVVYNDNYLLNFLSDDYDDEIGPLIAQFHSTNNWNGATFNGENFTFNLQYNNAGRITSRNIVYDFGSDLMVDINERFNYVN